MIVVAGQTPIQPDKREEAVQAALEMADATKKETGCITYDFYTSLRDPHTICVYEEWESQEALDAHFQTPHMAVFRAKLPNFRASEGKFKIMAVSNITTL